MPRELKEIDPDEISLVGVPAIRKKFIIIKRSQEMDEYIEILKSFHGEEEITDEVVEALKAGKMPEEATKALKGALNILNKYKDDFPDAILDAIKTLSKYASYGYPEKKGEKSEKEPDPVEFLEKLDLQKAGASLSKATIEKLNSIKTAIKSITDEIDKLIGKKEEAAGLKKSKEDDKGDLPEDVKRKLLELQELKDRIAEQERLTKEDKEKKARERIEKLETELEETKTTLTKIEASLRSRGIKKQIKEKEGDPDPEDADVDPFPSISIDVGEEG